MASRKNLRPVGPDEKRQQPKTITEAAAGGTVLELYEALRARIAKQLEDPNCPPRELASLSKRLQEVVRDIEAIHVREREDDITGAAGTADEKWSAI